MVRLGSVHDCENAPNNDPTSSKIYRCDFTAEIDAGHKVPQNARYDPSKIQKKQLGQTLECSSA